MQAQGGSGPMLPSRSPKLPNSFKTGKAAALLSPNSKSSIASDPQAELEHLERELQRVAQVCVNDECEDDPNIQRLLQANSNILERIKHLQDAIGTKISSLGQPSGAVGLPNPSDRPNHSVIPQIGRVSAVQDRTDEVIRK